MELLLEYVGVLTGLLYIFLEIKQHRAMWIVGFLTSLLYVFVFFFSKIYADMGLQIYYVAISVYGFLQWTKNGKNGLCEKPEPASVPQDKIIYSTLTPRLLVGVLLAIIVLFFLIYTLLNNFTDSPIPIGDAFTTSVGIVATWMVARRIIEHWVFWIVANGISVYLYFVRELYPTMFLYICYALLAAIGLYTWKKKGIRNVDNTL
ncbi:MAG: nicotinamide riboside transporter PnuC [Bacteroidales bacterium]|nr:nicotinamide riboside transporter PnuC [Bacteroidales bacterium]